MTLPVIIDKYIDLSDIDTSGRVTGERCDPENPKVIELSEGIAEDGLMQPIVVSQNPDGSKFPYKLVAGGRRYAAFTLLAGDEVPGDNDPYQRIPARIFDNLPLTIRLKLEWEENNNRENVDWQLNVLHVVAYHNALKKENALAGQNWSQRATGKIIGYSQSSISSLLDVGKALIKEDSEVMAADTFRAAIQVLMRRKLDDAQQTQLSRLKAKRKQVTGEPALATSPVSKLNLGPLNLDANTQLGETLLPKINTVEMVSASPAVRGVEISQGPSLEELSQLYFHGSCLDLLPRIHTDIGIDHIICDPPYGISMDNFASDMSRVSDTHGVEDNLELLPEFLRIAFDCIKSDGFLAMWYDLDHHEKIGNWARKIGWKVQRWPLIWCKTSPCQNTQAQANLTKVTEVCYIFRRSEETVLRTKSKPNYVSASACASSSHPFVKPDYIWGYLLENLTSEGQTVVDPFAGEGSMMAAALKRNRAPFGIELDEKHIAAGVNYIQSQLTTSSYDSAFAEPDF